MAGRKPKPKSMPIDDEGLIAYWQRNLGEAAEFFFPDIKFTSQQREAFEELSRIVRAKLRLADGLRMTSEDTFYAKKIGLSIQSGNGTGKDAFAACVILLFTYLFPDPKNSATANTAKQLKNVLWSEMSKWMRRYCRKATPESKYTIMEERLELQAEKLFAKELKGEGWFTEAVTINTTQTDEEQAEAIAGRHEDYQIVVIDEACGISDAVFNKLERTLTRKLNVMLLIFNPTRTKGYAIESQRDPRFISLRWNAEESELVTKEHIENMENKYGRDSNPFRISVLGLPPVAETDALIPWDWIQESVNRMTEPPQGEPTIKAMDCGAGGDKSIILARKGNYVFPLKRNTTSDSIQLIGWGANEIDDADVFVVDKRGIGFAVHGRLAEVKGWRVRSYDGATKSSNQDRWNNKRDECYLRVRDKFEQGVMSIPEDKELINQLAVLKVKYDSKGCMHIVRKEDVKKLIGHSSDEADALAMSYSVHDASFRKEGVVGDKYRKRRELVGNIEHSWMGA